MSSLFRILALWRHRALWLLLGMAVSLAAVAAGIVLLGSSGAVVAAAVAGAGALAAPALLDWVGAARVVLRYLERLTTHAATFRALADLRVWFFRGLAASAAGGLGFRRAGDVLSRLVNDVEALDGLYLRIIVPLAAAVLLLPALVLMVLLVPQGPGRVWLAIATGLLFCVSAFVLPWGGAKAAASAGARLASTMADLRIAILDALSGLREVRAYGAEGRMLATIQARQGALLRAQRDQARRAAWAGAGAFLCGQLGVAAVLAAIATGTVTAPAGMLVAGVFLTIALFEAVGGLSRAGTLAGHAAAAATRVLSVAGDTPQALAEPAVSMPVGHALRFEAVRFGWRSGAPVLDGFHLDLPQGARVALLGPSGAGKSTVAALALRVAAPWAGRVLMGGADAASLPVAEYRARFAWLSQTTHLFDDTIRNNLLLARPDAGDAALWEALDQARIGDVVRRLPDVLETWVGEGGHRFSGGQGRRLALARALLSPAPVLILDEPCAGLDAQTERDFFATLNDVAGNRSVLLIAHRLTGVEKLDRIYRLSGGHAVAAAA